MQIRQTRSNINADKRIHAPCKRRILLALPDVDHKLEQLLRLEIQFHALRSEPQLGGYNLDFSNKHNLF